jgi:redox-sensitive bicupin YhaK (pirin superfamily)
VTHSEQNASSVEPVHFLQIWVVPDTRGLPPRYDQKPFDVRAAGERLVLLASRDGRDGSIQVQQDLTISVTRLGAGQARSHALAPGRHAWVQVAAGSAVVNGAALAEGDGAAVSEEARVDLEGAEPAELLLFDLA